MPFGLFLNYKKLYINQLHKWNKLALDYTRLVVKYRELAVKYREFTIACSSLKTEFEERENSLINSMETLFVPLNRIEDDHTTAVRYGINYKKKGSRIVKRLVLVTMHESLFERIKGNLAEADIYTLQSKDFPPRIPTEREIDAALKDLK
jgi:hypothetical protein